jgi:hypothetical protein
MTTPLGEALAHRGEAAKHGRGAHCRRRAVTRRVVNAHLGRWSCRIFGDRTITRVCCTHMSLVGTEQTFRDFPIDVRFRVNCGTQGERAVAAYRRPLRLVTAPACASFGEAERFPLSCVLVVAPTSAMGDWRRGCPPIHFESVCVLAFLWFCSTFESTDGKCPNIHSASASIAHSVIHASTRWPSRSILSMIVPESDANETGPPRGDPVREEHERFATEGSWGSECLCRFNHRASFRTKSTLGRVCIPRRETT